MAIHNEAKVGEIAKTVIMPGDPIRAKLIADKFLENVKLVNSVRGIYAFTGTYKGKELTVMASGMGMPSMGIYCYELYTEYNVETIIRVGSCGAWTDSFKLLDIILVDNSYTEGNFAYNFSNEKCDFVSADKELNEKIMNEAYNLKIPCNRANIACTECFDIYTPDKSRAYRDRVPKEYNVVGAEMESFSLFYVAKFLKKKAACLLTVVDLNIESDEKRNMTPKERENSLLDMIRLALETSAK